MTELACFEAELELSRPFRIARGTTETLQAIFVRIREGEHTGWGEASPSPSVTDETHQQTLDELTSVDPDAIDTDDVADTIERHEHLPPAARSALDLALHDLAGQRASQPVHALVDLPAGDLPCAGTITVSSPDEAVEQARAWLKSGFFHLKVKIGDAEDGYEAVSRIVEDLPGPLPERLPQPEVWVDANESLTFDQAEELLPRFDELGVRLVEQPLHRDEHAQLAGLVEDAPLPILLDESVLGPEDVLTIGRLEGPTMVNIKVQKIGGLRASLACLDAARATGTPIVVGCNIETGLGIAAGSALCGTVDRADLDGNRFLALDPFPLPRPRPGFAGTTESAGLGAHPDPDLLDELQQVASLGNA